MSLLHFESYCYHWIGLFPINYGKKMNVTKLIFPFFHKLYCFRKTQFEENHPHYQMLSPDCVIKTLRIDVTWKYCAIAQPTVEDASEIYHCNGGTSKHFNGAQ